MLNYEEITAELVQARACKVIRRHIKESGRTYAEIAEILDVEQRTLESWGRGESTPKLFHFLRLMQFFSDSFSNEPEFWIRKKKRVDKSEEKVLSYQRLAIRR